MTASRTFDLPRTASAGLQGEDWRAVAKAELEGLGPHGLPLQAALMRSSAVHDQPVQVRILSGAVDGSVLAVRFGVFFQGIVTGCNCSDDPEANAPVDEYAEFSLELDLATARGRLTVLD